MKQMLLVPVLLVAVAACDGPGDDGQAAPVGTLLESGTGVPGTAASVEFPEGRLDFTVSEPTEDLPAFDETYDRAVDGASFVAVTWSYDFTSAVPAMRTPDAPDLAPSVRLVADGREYSLDDAVRPGPDDVAYGSSAVDYSGTVWVAVEGEPEELAIRLEYDGLDQEVAVESPPDPPADRGPAQALYRDRTAMVAARGACAGPTYEGGNGITLASPVCSVSAVRVPYRSEVGWVASRDDTWLVVDVTADPGVGARRGDEFFTVGEAPFSLTLDGVEPAAVATNAETGRSTAIFASEAFDSGRLVVAADYPTDEGPVIAVRWSVPIS